MDQWPNSPPLAYAPTRRTATGCACPGELGKKIRGQTWELSPECKAEAGKAAAIVFDFFGWGYLRALALVPFPPFLRPPLPRRLGARASSRAIFTPIL